MNKKFFYVLFIILYFFMFSFVFSDYSYAADPKLITKLNSAFSDIEKWILKLSTPAAAIAIGTGVFMRKFSFGDEEKIRTGKKLIKGTLFSYAFILGIDLILAAIKQLID